MRKEIQQFFQQICRYLGIAVSVTMYCDRNVRKSFLKYYPNTECDLFFNNIWNFA